jgi:hypothetical protein
MGELVCSQQCPQFIACFSFSQNLNNNGTKKTVKKERKKGANLGSKLRLWFSKP